jgi:hypothetical protein
MTLLGRGLKRAKEKGEGYNQVAMVGSEANAPGGPGDLQNTTATLVTMLDPRGCVIFIIE